MKRGGRRPRTKGEPAFYEEMKKRAGISVTPTALEGFDERAAAWDVSKSELIERIGRGIIPLLSPQEVERLGESLASTKPSSMSNSKDLGSTKGEKLKENRQHNLFSWLQT